jgi:hypothetical protein
MKETPLNEEFTWKDLVWRHIVQKPYDLYAETGILANPNIIKFRMALVGAIDEINRVLPVTSTITRKVQVALFPTDQYRRALELGNEIPKWVKVCRRDERTCYDISIANEWGSDLQSIPPDQRREIIHEIAHEIHPCFSSDMGWVPASIREGAVEVIPRILLGLQKHIEGSTDFIQKEMSDKLIDPIELDKKGLFYFSDAPLSFNPAYLSATAFVAGLAVRLGEGNIKTGLMAIKKLAEDTQEEEKFKLELAAVLGLENYDKIDRIELQKEGLNLIK